MKSFEEKLEELEKISEKIKSRKLPLQEVINCFDEGIKLSEELESELKKAERKVEIITASSLKEENPEPELFSEIPE